jgi:hypothetical protein
MINDPRVDQVTVGAIRTLFDVTNAKRLEVTGKDGESLTPPRMTEEEQVAQITAIFNRARARQEAFAAERLADPA